MRLMGIDYGLRRIGLSLSEGEIANPLGRVNDLAGVARLALEHQVEKLVIGLPDPKNTKIRLFGDRLSEVTGIGVEYWDETLSTRQARRGMIAAGKPAKDRQREIDQNAAAVILQSYIDNNRSQMPL